jgi:hypothetical protein
MPTSRSASECTGDFPFGIRTQSLRFIEPATQRRACSPSAKFDRPFRDIRGKQLWRDVFVHISAVEKAGSATCAKAPNRSLEVDVPRWLDFFVEVFEQVEVFRSGAEGECDMLPKTARCLSLQLADVRLCSGDAIVSAQKVH